MSLAGLDGVGGSAAIDPKDLTLRPSAIGGTFAGDDEMVAPASLIEPKLSAVVATGEKSAP